MAPALQCCSTGAGPHAMAKPVTTFASANFGLVCPLHGKSNFGVGNLDRLRTAVPLSNISRSPTALPNCIGKSVARRTARQPWRTGVCLAGHPPVAAKELELAPRERTTLTPRSHPAKVRQHQGREETGQCAKTRLGSLGRLSPEPTRSIIWKIPVLPG